MAMNPRLLRPRATGYDPAAQVYFNAVAVADGQQLEPAVKKAINDFVVGCKRDGIWNAIKASCILMGARTLSGALTPLVGAAPTNVNFVSGDYNRKTGLVGNGSTKYLNSNRNNNADPQNSNHNAIYLTSIGTLITMGAGGILAGVNTVGGVASRSRNSASDSYGATLVAPTLVGISRSGSASYTQRFNASSQTATRASETPANANVNILYDGVSTYGSHRAAFYSIGESLDLALLDSRISTLYTALGAAIP